MRSLTSVVICHLSLCLLLRLLALQEGETALHMACREKKLELSKWLIEKMSREAALGLNQVRKSDRWMGRWVGYWAS